jgi:hypothetical protein
MLPITMSFGLHLDGQRGLQPANRLGEAALGPLGLLGLLETQLGLAGAPVPHVRRIVAYRECLVRADGPGRFYHASFATDELGTAATLLAWRDLWNLHGWNGTFPADAPPRLADLAAVEDHARERVPASVGERLARVRERMQSRRPAVAAVRLFDRLETLPARWREVLAQLPWVEAGEPAPRGQGFLGRLQARLIEAAAGQGGPRLTWEPDGTVTVARAQTRALAGAWLARQALGGSSLLVAPSGGARLDAMLAAADLPRFGLGEASAFRPALQVLPLALELLWEPLNFHALVQFLTHPVCPLPAYARRRLADKVADRPGIGGAAWETALADIDTHYTERSAAVREAIGFWVEHPRHAAESGAPLATVIGRVQRLAEFFRQRLGDADPAARLAWQAGYAQCRACVESVAGLADQGVAAIRPWQLQTLLAQATARGGENPLHAAEVGAGLAITYPAAAVEPADQVTWWQLAMPALPAPYPWSAAELRALAAAGADLPSAQARLERTAREWLRPVLAARRRLTLVLPPPGEEVHPLWQMIEALVDRPRIEALESLLTEPSPVTAPVAHRPLPAPRRWWRLPPEVQVPLRDTESFSSLELLLFGPYRWLLKYAARLRPSGIAALGEPFRIYGNLAHALVDALFRRPDALTMNEAELAGWFAPAFRRLVAEEGALLLMPGRGADLEGFRYRLWQAVRTLRRQLARAGIRAVTPERELAGQFVGGELLGYADLVVRNAAGAHAVIDMKWSGAKKYPLKLKENRHLQLALYAELLRQQEGAWPAVAYYLLDRARLLAPAADYFPEAEAVASRSGENTAQLWQRFEASWRWRAEQVRASEFEVALESIVPTDESEPPADAIAPEYLDEAYDEYRALAGWEPTA